MDGGYMIKKKSALVSMNITRKVIVVIIVIIIIIFLV